MGLFSTRNSDGASGLAESINNISTKDWRNLQGRARKANPQLADMFSDESVARSKAGAAQLRKAGQS